MSKLKAGDVVTFKTGPQRTLKVIRIGGDPNRSPFNTGPDGVLVEWEQESGGYGRAWFKPELLQAPDAKKPIGRPRRVSA